MDDSEDSSRTALKIVFVFSLLLIFMDIYELYFSYYSLIDYAESFLPEVFEQCVKYHIITQMFFTVFAAFAGFSACIMSFFMLFNYHFFINKLIETFMFYNFYAFGPILLGLSTFAFIYFDKVCNICDNDNYTKQYINFVTVACLVISFLVSLLITVWYSAVGAFDLFNNSIRFTSDGNYIIGKIFWKIVFNRGTQELSSEPNEHHIELEERLNANNVLRLDE